MEPQPSYIGPPPISPMEYDYKVEQGVVSPQSNLVPQGPSSGPGVSNYSIPSPGGYYHDYNQPLLQQQNSFGSFQSGFMNGTFEEQFYNRGVAAASPRFHPYVGRTPVPTPSPSASVNDMKEERLTPNTPEILDLDSHKVLSGSASQQQHQMGPLPPMWRPHEQFPSPAASSNVCASPIGFGASFRPPSTGLSSGQSPTGLGPSPAPSPSVVSPMSAGPPPGLPPSLGNVGHPQSTLVPPSGLGLSAGLNIRPGLGAGPLSMVPQIQSSYGGQRAMPPSHAAVPSVSNNSAGFPINNAMSPFYAQGLAVSSAISTSSTGHSSVHSKQSSTKDVPTTEYPSNVKRAKSFKCEDCNKWFTSHGHLKRHYNTTLHKNMSKLNNNSSANTTQPSAVVTAAAPLDITRTPVISPSSKSLEESSATSSHDEGSNLSTTDSLEANSNVFQHAGSAFQPLSVASSSNYATQNSAFPAVSTVSVLPINSPIAQHSQQPIYPSEQPLTAPTMYHGHFSTNPSSYLPQPPSSGSGGHFFLANNYICYPQQGGSHGPGFHSMNEYPGPSPVEGFNSFRLDNDRPSLGNPGSEPTTRNSPEPGGDTGSEASMDSSGSSSAGPADSYKCGDCNKTFNRMCYLTQHRSTYHEGEKPFKCGICGKRFTDEITFTDHQGKHAGEKPYKCEICPKQFNHKTDLRRHMCLHTGEKPFSCEHCGKGFIRKDHMLKHFQTHRKKAMAAAANVAPAHPSMSHNPSGFPTHPGLPPSHGSLSHPSHAPRGPPHVVAPTVY